MTTKNINRIGLFFGDFAPLVDQFKAQWLAKNLNSVCYEGYSSKAVQLAGKSFPTTSAAVILSLATSLKCIYLMIFIVVSMPLVSANSCMHVSCKEAYNIDKCGCYFPGQCGDSYGVSRAYQTCESGGRLICKTIPSVVGKEGQCITVVNWANLLNCAGSLVNTAIPCYTALKKKSNREDPTKSEWAACLAAIGSAVTGCQLCGQVTTCSEGVLMPKIANEVIFVEILATGECRNGGGRYPCDPF